MYITTYILREEKDLLKIAKNLFGDIVQSVYYAYWYDKNVNIKEYTERFDMYEKQSSNNDLTIDQDDKTIIIYFTNGKKVIFSNSEWGAMEAFNQEEVKEII